MLQELMTLMESMERSARAFERIASAMESLAIVMKRTAAGKDSHVEVDVVYADRDLAAKMEEKQPEVPPPAEEAPPAALTDPQEDPVAHYSAMSLDQLKAEVEKLGIEIPKGTRATTLVKWLTDPSTRPVAPPEETEPAAAGETAAPSIEEVKAALVALGKAKGFVAAKGIVSQFGIASVPDLPEDKYAEFVAACKKAAAAA